MKKGLFSRLKHILILCRRKIATKKKWLKIKKWAAECLFFVFFLNSAIYLDGIIFPLISTTFHSHLCFSIIIICINSLTHTHKNLFISNFKTFVYYFPLHLSICASQCWIHIWACMGYNPGAPRLNGLPRSPPSLLIKLNK